MTDFYIVTDVPPITADSADEAARQHAQAAGISAGLVLVAKGAKQFDITVTPATVSVEARP